ncbi:cyclophane-forming radical SAM/SPASM peptide maturase YhhB [Pedobacter jejuensis]|uniref:FxsB family radical SAM/SPASM domain protein n=1 Tax=Pedobacter jejuensis TaxID=1268550 RepID=A0A3N0BUT7_9SPHI|nr:cyclophane-forming radical SAM/SPASM peptide maturase YhhB [Pedobacter jejuensis]RNL53137.1 FxsB family radical SAM/SPASM domain protein [Pedobacter jejuensis]
MQNDALPATVSCFLLKVASRCNINCDYCYMYNHLDQSYKQQPKFMSKDIMSAATHRIVEYVLEKNLKRVAVVYHGGEPLLMQTDRFVSHIKELRSALPIGVEVEFSMQTNGILLTEDTIRSFQACGLQISLSIDGPESANNRHRLDHQGKPSFAATENALKLLQRYPSVFSGVIAVIDPRNDPQELLNFFASYDLPQLDFLLPDANFLTPPKLRDEQENIFVQWLINCFDIWFDEYPNIKIRTFDSILAGLLGVPSETDGFGFGDVSLITIETNGSYHDLDVLKITGGGTYLDNGDVFSAPIKDAVASKQVEAHRKLLKKEGLAKKCQECEIVEICGGGAVAHRYGNNGYENPSIYCSELEQLIRHIQFRVYDELAKEEPLDQLDEDFILDYELDSLDSQKIHQAKSFFMKDQVLLLKAVLSASQNESVSTEGIDEDSLQKIAIMPSVVVWTEVMKKNLEGRVLTSTDGTHLAADVSYLQSIIDDQIIDDAWPLINRADEWLRKPFGKEIHFEDRSANAEGMKVLEEAFELITSFKPSLIEEMRLISPEIQLIRDLKADPEQVVSFSDNSVPGALYVQLMRGESFIDPSDLADSLIHEHRHQKLYLLQRLTNIVDDDHILVNSPWRTELRPPSGLFHALYVFSELLEFWNFLRKKEDYRTRAEREYCIVREKLRKGFITMETCKLTPSGKALLKILEQKANLITDGATS